MVSLKLKLLSSLLYLFSSVYIFIKFINFLLNPQFQFYLNSPIIINRLIGGQFYCTNKVGYIGSIISRVKFTGSKAKIGVLVIDYKVEFLIVLVKLFLRRYLIYPKLNSPLVAIYSLILYLIYFIGSSSYSILQSNCRTIIYLFFLTYTL